MRNPISRAACAGLFLVLAPALAAAQQPAGGKPFAGREPFKALPGGTSGSLAGDLAYYPIAPCRIFDSRPGSGLPGASTGPLLHGTAVALQVTDSGTGLPCGLPYPAAKAVMLNFIAVGPAGAGDLRAWPWDSTNAPLPNSSVLNYTVANGLNIANGIIAPICDVNASTGGDCSFDEFMRADAANTHVVIDALGYFAAAKPRTLTCVVADHGLSVPALTVTTITSPDCPVGYQATGGGFFTSNPGVVFDVGVSPIFAGTFPAAANFWSCQVSNQSNGPVNVTCRAMCCRVGPDVPSL